MSFLYQDFDVCKDFDGTKKLSSPITGIPPSRITFPNITSKHRYKKSRTQKPLKKKLSRISLVFEKYKEKLSTGEEETNYTTSIGSNEETIPRQTKSISTFISITLNCVLGENSIKSIVIQLPQDATVLIAIEKGINEFNKEFKIENAKIRIKENSELFVLKPAKKNGKPKVDMPFFDRETTIYNAQTLNFTLCWKENPHDYMKMYEKNKKKKTCDAGCHMF